MPNDKPPKDEKQDELAALYGLKSESESDDADEEEDEQAPAMEDGGASSSASGFVGMLAKDGAGAAPASRGDAGRAEEAGEIPLRRRSDAIHMAREILPVARPTPGKRIQKTVPGWYHIAVPAMFTLGFILFFIGVWAIGALIYMGMSNPASPADVGYPLLEWRFDASGDGGAFAAGSKIMAVSMLLCIPLSIALCVMGGLIRKQIRLAAGPVGK